MAMARLGKQVVDLEHVSVEYSVCLAAPALDGGTPFEDPRSASSLRSGAALLQGFESEEVGKAEDSERAPAVQGEPAACEKQGESAAAAKRVVLDDVSWIIGPGDRYGIVGENGAGKTTLLKVIQGVQAPTRGRVKIGQTVRFAVLSQHLDELAAYGSDRVRQVIARYSRRIMLDGKEATPAQLLERLGFTKADLNEPVCDLSGGQKRRLALMLILLDEPNVLILDEPGNDLDTDMLAQVETLLDGWPGTLLLVTHDRYLMERVTDHQFAILDGKVRHLPGGVDEYLRLVNRAAASNAGAGSGSTATKSTDSSVSSEAEKPRLSGGEQRALRKLMQSNERKVETLRGKIEDVRARMAAADPSDYVELGSLQAEIGSLEEQIDLLEMEWLEAAEKLGE
ncbi:MAG: ABC-F family ATP-binding cassette domain-containing protein [Eggerthellaceae bacterium]|nr:ABC-F family ATP-binding cassette domain-containing protein [Eggerthellaceae bacterium]